MKTKIEERNGISSTIEIGNIEVTELKVSDYQKKGTKTAVLKQTIKISSLYPAKSVSNNLQDNIFSLEEFGKDFVTEPYVSTRVNVAFMDVPEASTIESVTKKLAAFPNATLYRIMGNKPILNSNQEYAIKENLKTMDDFAKSQVVRYGADDDKDHKKGDLILDKHGKIQYKVTYFSATEKEDIDLRNADPSDFYVSPELEVEYNEALLLTA